MQLSRRGKFNCFNETNSPVQFRAMTPWQEPGIISVPVASLMSGTSMASLQDQLLKAGLIDAKKAKQANKEKRKETKIAHRTGEPQVDEVKQAAEQVRQEKIARDKALNRLRDQDQQQKAIAAQIRQLIENHRQSKGVKPGDEKAVEYNFTHGKHIKKMRVSPLVQEQIVRGVLVIVALEGGYELVPRIVADKISQRDAAAIVVANSKSSLPQDDDDPYKDYVIPDDLMW
ncbi:conserved hypothetical protein [Cellvibrio japonicus Ueda107]|uniref:Nucleoprotein/polynucleotide-associated enzyme n=2 Tax=Cellvibrio japonicus TaxID=155077 RepID=B3PIK6_CELJU|nr:conserved hypothetical protein [Cellvibrio japonicus Ueda107]